MWSSTPGLSEAARPQGRGFAALASPAARLVLTDKPATRSGIVSALCLGIVHLLWALLYVHAARIGAMDHGAMLFMLGVQITGILTVYACLRSGHTATLQDATLVLPQILWSTFSAVAGYALAPSLRPALLQAMCMIQFFGFFSLRPRQLAISGGSAITMLCAALALGGIGAIPQFEIREELYPALLSIFVLAAIMGITLQHSLRRGALREQKLELDAAVTAVRDLVVRDSLTGLFSRRHMQGLLREEQARALRSGKPFAVALLDLDHFKRINDTHGHGIGDEVLRRFADLASVAMRQSDTVARWGGEEFLVLMPETAVAADARQPLDRLRAEIAGQDAASLLGRLGVTFSGGIAFHLHGEPAEQVVASADRALYAAKAGGRNRSLIAERSEPPLTGQIAPF